MRNLYFIRFSGILLSSLVIVSLFLLLIYNIIPFSLGVISIIISIMAFVTSIASFYINYRLNSFNHIDNTLLELNKILIEHPEIIYEDHENFDQGISDVYAVMAIDFLETIYKRGYHKDKSYIPLMEEFISLFKIKYLDIEKKLDPGFTDYIKCEFSYCLKTNEK